MAKFSRQNRATENAVANKLTPKGAAALCASFETLNVGSLWSTDDQGQVTYISEAALNVLGDGEPVLGQRLVDLFKSSEPGAGGQRSLPFAMARKTRFERVMVPTACGEETRWWSISGEAQFGPLGAFAGYHGYCLDVTRERESADESSHLAMHDPLTGLANRRHMSQLLEKTVTAYTFQEKPCAIFLIDLDRFKQVNDTLGHSIGDALLKQVADRLVAIVGDKESVARVGGDEFQVILPDQEDRGQLGDLAERIITLVSQPYVINGSRCIIGASVGIAISPFDGSTTEDLVRNADLALYAAKHSGRGRFRFFSEELLEAAEQRRQLEESLHDALQRGELALAYQPIVNIKTNAVTGVEALVRWNHPERGQISPAVFIPIAEESSLITKISEWILRQACADAALWPGKLRVAVNISPRHFLEKSFPALVANALATSGIDPDRLELEITEGVFLHEGGPTDQTFQAMKTLGVRLALDDFGTGYSSLGYLKSAPFDKIKIDQSFVRDATQPGSRNKAIISAIVALADALGMETTAEGVETLDVLDMMKALNVSHVQGYIFSKAVTDAFLTERLQTENWIIEPSGPAVNREERFTMYRKIGAIHEDHYYQIFLRNLSASGALIEGLEDVPVGTNFVLDFGEGQLAVATVRRSGPHSQGLHFERPLVSDGNGGLCTSHRVSPYMLAAAGLPKLSDLNGDQPVTELLAGKISLPAFAIANGRAHSSKGN